MVSWTDSGTYWADGWQTKDEIVSQAKIETVRTVGSLFHFDEDAIFVALTHDEERKHFFGTQLIKRSNIVSVSRLTLAEYFPCD